MARIVVIDDRVTNRNILTRLALSVEEGLQVQAFASPSDALAKMDVGDKVDLIITDYNMPEMDGATFIETLRDRPGFADVPIIVVTVYEDRDFCYRALEAGATDFLLSPVDHLEFRARAKNLLTMRRQQKMLQDRASVHALVWRRRCPPRCWRLRSLSLRAVAGAATHRRFLRPWQQPPHGPRPRGPLLHRRRRSPRRAKHGR